MYIYFSFNYSFDFSKRNSPEHEFHTNYTMHNNLLICGMNAIKFSYRGVCTYLCHTQIKKKKKRSENNLSQPRGHHRTMCRTLRQWRSLGG